MRYRRPQEECDEEGEGEPARVVSMRFPDLPPEALSNSQPTKSWLMDANQPDYWPWSILGRVGPASDPVQGEIDKGIVEGVDHYDRRTHAPVDFKAAVVAPCKPYRVVRLLCCWCCQWQGDRFLMTRAQWLWTFNLLCLAPHVVFTVLCLYAGWEKNDGEMNVEVWRMKVVWTNTGASGYAASLVSNEMPVRIDYLAASFFGLSALFHLLALIMGFFDRFLWLYWRQLDLAFCWWRWVEYSVSASVMAMSLALLTGLRDANSLAFIFMSMWITMMCGLLTELYSRPAKLSDSQYDFSRWAGDPREVDPHYKPGDLGNHLLKQQKARSDRWVNYRRRMIPHVLGYFPYISAWVIILNNFFTQLYDLKLEDQDLFECIPDFVPYAIFGMVALFTCFTFVQIWYQWVPPRHYWKTEIWYSFLSATAKLLLGSLLYVNVLTAASFDESVEVSASCRGGGQ